MRLTNYFITITQMVREVFTMQPATSEMSEDAFLEFIQTRDEKWELVNGEAVMVAGSNQRHQAIVANTLAALHNQLRGKGCRPTAANSGVSTIFGTVRYPAIVVDCGRMEDQAMLATEPVLMVEVVSPATRDFNSHRKVFEYKSKPGIRYVLLVDTNDACALLHAREGEGWCETLYERFGDVIDFPELGATLALSDIYDGLDFKREPAREPVRLG